MTSSSAHVEWITQAASVELLDASHGVLGELIDPEIVLQGLRLCDNVGRMDDPAAALATQAMHSFTCQGSPEIPIELDNATSHVITVRWMDEQGRAHINGTIDPYSQMVRYSRCGHLFVLSAVMAPQNEHLIGAYRIRMPCSSGAPHQLLMEEETIGNIIQTKRFKLEALIADPTGHDELVIASAAMDTVIGAGPAAALTKTIHALHTIVTNLLQHPDDPKYQSLRTSNPKVQSTLLKNYAARQTLYCIGFRPDKEQEHWIYKPNANLHAISERLVQAKQLLDTLLQRSQPGFVAELSPSPVWQGPILNSSYVNANTRPFGSGGATHFLTDDEKWARVERNRMRRGGGGGRRPSPGNAPSSNGLWGR
jgi:PUB domain